MRSARESGPLWAALVWLVFTPAGPHRPLCQAAQDPPQSKSKPVRAPLPDASKVREAEKTVKELFKDEYAKKQPADRQKLIKVLLDQAKDVQAELPLRWVLYREAQDLAGQLGSVDIAFEAVDGAAAVFEIDALAAKNVVLASAAKSAKSPEDLGKLVEPTFKVIDAALAADDLENGDKAGAGAAQLARRLNAAPLAARVAARMKDLADLKARLERLKRALETLAKDQNNGPANLEAGLFYCLGKGDWETGIPYLARSSDPALKAAATREAGAPKEPQAQAEIADAWWDLAEKERSDLRQGLLYRRAAYWYGQAQSGASSLLKVKIQSRLETQHRRILSREGLEVTFLPETTSRGILVCECGDGRYEPSTAGGKPCIKMIKANAADVTRYVYLKLAEEWQESWKPAQVEVEYFDEGNGNLEVQYDGVSGPYRAGPKSAPLGGSKSWKILSTPIPDPMFRGRQNAGADLRISVGPGQDTCIRRVTVKLVQK